MPELSGVHNKSFSNEIFNNTFHYEKEDNNKVKTAGKGSGTKDDHALPHHHPLDRRADEAGCEQRSTEGTQAVGLLPSGHPWTKGQRPQSRHSQLPSDAHQPGQQP